MRELGIPEQLVGIERLVRIAALAKHVDIGGEVGPPREGNLGVATIGEIPRSEVVGGLQTVIGAGIGGTAIERDAEPVVAEAEGDRGIDVIGMCHVTLGIGRTIEIDITYSMGIIGIDGTTDVPSVQCVESDGEAHAEVGIPVAIDILRS